MNDKIIRKSERKQLLKRNAKTGCIYLTIYFLTFIISFIYSVQQFRITIIPLKIILAIHIVAGLLFGALTYKHYKILLGNEFNLFRHYFLAVLICGAVACGLFYITNKQFSKKEDYVIKSVIQTKHNGYGRSVKYITIDINGLEKDIPFPDTEMQEFNRSNYVVLTMRDGFWGFPVINKKELVFIPVLIPK